MPTQAGRKLEKKKEMAKISSAKNKKRKRIRETPKNKARRKRKRNPRWRQPRDIKNHKYMVYAKGKNERLETGNNSASWTRKVDISLSDRTTKTIKNSGTKATILSLANILMSNWKQPEATITDRRSAYTAATGTDKTKSIKNDVKLH